MAQLETWIRQDLKKPLQVQYLSGTMFSQDNAANLVGVEVFDDGEPATLGGSVSANVVRSDGGTVAVSGGTLSGNKVSVILPQAAYAIPGAISIIIKLTTGGTVTTLGAIVVTVYRSSTDAVIDPGTIIPSVQNLISQIETAVASIPADYSSLWTSLAPAFSTSTAYTAGQHVTYNGHLYRFTADHAAGSFVNTDCTQVDVGGELSALKSAITTETTTRENADNVILGKFDALDLTFDKHTGKIYVTIDGVKKGNGVTISVPYGIDVSTVVSWYRSQVQYAYDYIMEQPEGTISHVMVTDLHYNSNFRHSAAICNLLMDTGKFDKLWILGDLTDDNTDAQYENFINDGWGTHNGNIIFVLGNHDVRTPSGGYPTYQDFYDDFLSESDYGNAETLYYVYTDTINHIKYVVINTETITADANDPQLAMIRTAVSSSDYRVFVIGHRNLAFGMNLSQELGATVTAAITEAMKSGNADIIGYICGHQHIDVISPIDNAFYLSTWLCDRNETTNYYPGYSVTKRYDGTWSAQAITLISINPQSRSVKFLRIGAALSNGVWEYKYAANGANLPTISNKKITIYTDGAIPDNTKLIVNNNSEFSTTIVPEYNNLFGSIRASMGATDISATAITGNQVNIASVTDDVIINAMALPLNTELINFLRVGGTPFASYNEATGEYVKSGSSANAIIVNALKANDVIHVKYSGSSNVSGYYNTDPFAHDYANGEANNIYGAKAVDRDLLITADGTQHLLVYSSGTVSIKKVLPDTEELFTPSKLQVVKIGDANYQFNSDGTVSITGTASGTAETNSVKFVVPMIAGATYDLSIKSTGSGYALFAMMSDDTNANGQYTIMGGNATWSPSNFTYTTINATKEFANTVQTGRGKMIVRLNPATTYTVSIRLHQS